MIISALHGSGAKTILSVGLTVALKRRGFTVVPFKKGPDYIDAAWLSRAAGNPCRHLDLYLMDEQGVREVFVNNTSQQSIALIEGNRGLFDGVDIAGSYSTARIATLLKTPVLLVLDCAKMTNTASALVMGCRAFDRQMELAGVILNRISGKRHGDLISKSIEHHTGIPVLGRLPNLDIDMPERHLGLTTVSETEQLQDKLNKLAEIAETYLDLDRIIQIAHNAQGLDYRSQPTADSAGISAKDKVKIGIIRDQAFQFYYQENLEALQTAGAEIVEFNALRDKTILPVDLLYIGGGFPEVHAEKLSKNKSFRQSVRHYAEKGMPIYGECGAVIYLGRSVRFNGQKYEMCDFFPLDYELTRKPSGHGYSQIIIDQKNPFFAVGGLLKGHEFHYSRPVNWKAGMCSTAFSVKKGYGLDGSRDGLFRKNVLLSYTHLHAAGAREWASALVALARQIKFSKQPHYFES